VRLVVIIPALHRPDLTARCIQSFLRQGCAPNDYEILVVENDAANGPVLPDPLPPRVRRLPLDRNFGFTGAANRGIAAASSEYILLLNNDVELLPGFVSALLAKMQADPLCAIAGGKLLSAADHAVLDGAGDAWLLGGGAYRLGHGDRDDGQFDKLEPLSCCGAALLLRRSALEQIGGLDDDFFAYLDDVDLALRARLAGFHVLYVPEAKAVHVGSATLGEAQHPKAIEWITRNQTLVVLKNYPASLLLRLLPRLAVFHTLWFSRVVSQGNFLALLRGIFGALGLLPRAWHKRRLIQNSRKLSPDVLLRELRKSEAQIGGWQQSLAPERRSKLLSAYFAICGRLRM
jgi:GT2 family glycosyltransferase